MTGIRYNFPSLSWYPRQIEFWIIFTALFNTRTVIIFHFIWHCPNNSTHLSESHKVSPCSCSRMVISHFFYESFSYTSKITESLLGNHSQLLGNNRININVLYSQTFTLSLMPANLLLYGNVYLFIRSLLTIRNYIVSRMT